MTITWEAAGVICAIAAVIMAGQMKLTQLMIRDEVARAITKLNGLYVKAELCKERHDGCRADLLHRISQAAQGAD